MGALIKLELHNLFRQKSFYVCVGINALLAVIFYLIWAYTPIQVGDIFEAIMSGEELPEKTSSGFAASLSTLSMLANYFPLILGIAMVSFIVPDYTQNTMKNVYSRGFSRTQVFFAKYVASLVIMGVMLAMIFLFSFIAGTIQFSAGQADGKYFALLGGQILVAVAFATVEFAICIMLKNIPGSIVLIIVSTMIFSQILLFVDLLLLSQDVSFQTSKFWLSSFFSDRS